MNIICIDEEQLALEFLKSQLEKISDVKVQKIFTSPLQGLDYILKKDVDIVFLAIKMSEINGIRLAEQILQKNPNVIIIFVTAYNEFAVEAFQLNALDYIVKPVTTERLKVASDRAKKEAEQRQREMLYKRGSYLHIQVAPFLAFENENKKFIPLQWRTRKAEELFIYLLQNNNVLVEKLFLIELLWPEYDMEKAYAILYTTIYNVRKTLNQYHDHIELTNFSDGYILKLQNVQIDMFTWEKRLAILPPISESSISDYEQVMRLNKGFYLEHHDYIWLESEKHRLNELWMQIALKIATYYTDAKKMTNAIKWNKRILERDSAIEEAHFNLMKLYEANGEFTLMMEQYNKLYKVLRKGLQGKPSDYIIKWYIGKLS